jgi:hypothetical protein
MQIDIIPDLGMLILGENLSGIADLAPGQILQRLIAVEAAAPLPDLSDPRPDRFRPTNGVATRFQATRPAPSRAARTPTPGECVLVAMMSCSYDRLNGVYFTQIMSVCNGSTAACQQFITWAAGFGQKRTI